MYDWKSFENVSDSPYLVNWYDDHKTKFVSRQTTQPYDQRRRHRHNFPTQTQDADCRPIWLCEWIKILKHHNNDLHTFAESIVGMNHGLGSAINRAANFRHILQGYFTGINISLIMGQSMMTSWGGNAFRIISPLSGKHIGDRLTPHTGIEQNAELRYFSWF